MRKLVYKGGLLLLLALWTVPTLFATPVSSTSLDASAPKREFTRSIKKEFAISATGQVTLGNKYGKIHVDTWDEDQVKIEVTITVNAGTENRAEAIFDRLQIEFENSPNSVRAETNIESSKDNWTSSWWDEKGKGEFKIEYEVFMPRTCNLDVSNKYGHTTVAALESNAKVTAKYGDVYMTSLTGDLDLDIGYGNANIERSNDAKVLIKYGKLRLNEARDIKMDSKYSKIDLTKVRDLDLYSKYNHYRLGDLQSLNIQGKYDDFEVESVREIKSDCSYTDFEVHQLHSTGKFTMRYGSLHVEKLERDFAKVEVDGEYTGVKIDVENGAAYSMDIATSHAGVTYPDGANIHYDVEQNSRKQIRGTIGGQEGERMIRVRSSYGHIRIR
ncbi:MAG: DUF4097 family beta strand repeat-containing protein [Bacteroidota bacterium]